MIYSFSSGGNLIIWASRSLSLQGFLILPLWTDLFLDAWIIVYSIITVIYISVVKIYIYICKCVHTSERYSCVWTTPWDSQFSESPPGVTHLRSFVVLCAFPCNRWRKYTAAGSQKSSGGYKKIFIFVTATTFMLLCIHRLFDRYGTIAVWFASRFQMWRLFSNTTFSPEPLHVFSILIFPSRVSIGHSNAPQIF